MTTIPTSTSGLAQGSSSSNTISGTKANSLTANDFIKFLVTQLQHQDPLQPTDSNQMLSQLTSIGQLQSATDMDTALKGMVQQSSIGSAATMIGKQVQGTDAQTNPISGIVSSVQVTSTGVNLQLTNGTTMALANLTNISTPPTAAGTAAASTPAS